jgi:hypothetical protein
MLLQMGNGIDPRDETFEMFVGIDPSEWAYPPQASIVACTTAGAPDATRSV